MSRRAIVAFPEPHNLHLIQQIHGRYNALASIIASHLTLVFPFESHLTAEQLHTHIQQAIVGFSPFPIELRGFTGSEGEYIFLNVKRGNDQIIELHDRLYTGPLAPYLSLEHTYVPHVTVGRLSNRATFLEALTAAQAITATFQTTVSEIAVYSLDTYSTEFAASL